MMATKHPDVGGGDNEAPVAGAKLRKFIERLERLGEDKKAISADISEVKKEAKENGFNMKAINDMLKLRADPTKRKNELALEQLYAEALGITDIFG